MGDVVEGFAHAFDEGLILVEHLIEQPGQLVEFIVRIARRHAGIHVASADN